ncbi:DNA-binding IscR family transcriptional regulator [Sporomusaceae bacterium BoRhaA]|uniref:Rrf2 family transcriptional regulator n=1 Tax=Pelorhabdus rhamnosifermentans TaxID=2772457 RepID=UPI001C062962|nr:Rrf2 family transcriptional regulator [Pelorhabdus rhamnosifermentans]MBU2699481.1 DNA-binding IscR family transcriptional regulator [Pelorhabdus rhamnosifermentans]
MSATNKANRLISEKSPYLLQHAYNLAMHCIVAYMIKYDKNENLSLQPLANHLNISATYLSKILTQLVKADII